MPAIPNPTGGPGLTYEGVVLMDAATGKPVGTAGGTLNILQGVNGADSFAAGAASAAFALPANGGAVSLRADGGKIRYTLGLAGVATGATQHAVGDQERMELLVGNATHIALMSDDGGEYVVDVSGLGAPPVYA